MLYDLLLRNEGALVLGTRYENREISGSRNT